jgi:PAS fold
MDEAGNSSFRDEHDPVTPVVIRRRLLAAFSGSCAIGFAILDNRLRYEAINNCLAASHGVPARAHLGHTVREILGEVGAEAASRCQRVLATGEPLRFEITNAALPGGIQGAYWRLNTCFPIQDCAGSVIEVGIMAVDVTDQRRLEKLLCELAGNLRNVQTRENFWLARELHDSIEDYHLALAFSLELLVRQQKKSTELLAQSIEGLDQRIRTMKNLVASVASRFPIDK